MRATIDNLGRRARAALPAAIVAAVVAVGGILLGWRLAGPSEAETSLGRVSFTVEPSLDGGVRAYVPVADWGFRAPAFDAPFLLDVELRAFDRQALLAAAGGDVELLRSARDDFRRGARSAVLRAFGFGIGAVALLALAIAVARRAPRRRRATLALGTIALAVVASAAVLLRVQWSFDERAFERPTYYARGGELAQLLAVVERERAGEGYSSSFEGALRSFSAFLTDVGPSTAPGRSLFAASDLHDNVLVLDPLRDLIAGQPVILAGDFAQQGNEAEGELVVEPVAALSEQVVAVSGNHDSSALMSSLSGEGVTVLSDRPRSRRESGARAAARVSGLRVAGFSDPLEWQGPNPDSPERVFAFPELPDGEQRAEQAEADLVTWFDRQRRPPDLVAVHQSSLAQALAAELYDRGYARALTIVTGHDHRQHVDRYGDVTVVDGGSLGAGGVFGAGQQFAGLAQLHFARPQPVLKAVDLIRVEPLSGAAQAQRVVLGRACPGGGERCSYEPGEIEVEVPDDAG